MKKILTITMLFIGVLVFTGCTTTKEINVAIKPSYPKPDSEVISLVLHYYSNKALNTDFFYAPSGVYHLAKIAKERGYNYIRLTYPPQFKEMMINNAKELKECYTKNTLDLLGTNKCVQVRRTQHKYSHQYYGIAGIAYKTQPSDVLTIPIDDILEEFKEYDLSKDNYKVSINIQPVS